MSKVIKSKMVKSSFLALLVFVSTVLLAPAYVFAADTCGGGTNESSVKTAIDIGCRGNGNPIVDMLFAIIRFLSLGVGLVVVASIVVAGIQYSTSQGDPQMAAKAKKRIQSALTALIVFIFAYAILNYIVPSTVFGL
jgi:hypothetical protein